MPRILSEKIRVGVSACNFGALVRYNRKGWDRIKPLGREHDAFIWTPVCPEVMAGLGVPRKPVRLVRGNGDDFWQNKAIMKNRSGRDVSQEMRVGMQACLDTMKTAGVEAFVFMEGSPTCGVYRTTLKNKRLGKPPGAFGSLLLREGYFLIPAVDLESPVKWWDWRRRLHAWAWLKREPITSKSQLYEIWHDFKFICQEVDRVEADRIGRELADLTKRPGKAFYENWKQSVLNLLRRPSDYRRIQSVMQKHYAHYRKHLAGKTGSATTPTSRQSKHGYIDELHDMEIRAFKENYTFAGSPVFFRD